MNINQFAIYQLKAIPENHKIKFRPYAVVQALDVQIRSSSYNQVYLGTTFLEDSPNLIYERFLKNPPRKFSGHKISVSDVIVHNKNGVTTAYYIDKESLVVIAGFIRFASSSSLITMDTKDYPIEGYKGSWVATDEIIVDGKQFFMMENEQYGRNVAAVIMDAEGKLVTDDCTNGFDEKALQQIQEYLHPPKNEHLKKQEMENYQKYYENGEYLRSAEISEEQNYNMIDGRINNKKKRKISDPKNRPSVLKRLNEKRAELAQRYGKKEQEIQMERNRK